MSQEYLRWYGERQTHSDPHQAKLAREAYANQMQYLEQKYSLIEYALKAGIRLAAGTDSFIGDVRFDALPDEIRYLVEYGCTPMQGIQTATLWEAQAMGWNDLGSLQTGMSADVIAVDGNPITDIRALNKVTLVVLEDEIVFNKNLK